MSQLSRVAFLPWCSKRPRAHPRPAPLALTLCVRTTPRPAKGTYLPRRDRRATRTTVGASGSRALKQVRARDTVSVTSRVIDLQSVELYSYYDLLYSCTVVVRDRPMSTVLSGNNGNSNCRYDLRTESSEPDSVTTCLAHTCSPDRKKRKRSSHEARRDGGPARLLALAARYTSHARARHCLLQGWRCAVVAVLGAHQGRSSECRHPWGPFGGAFEHTPTHGSHR